MDPLFHIPRSVRNRSQFVICTAALEPSSITLLLSPQWLLQILLPFTLLVSVEGGEGYFYSRMRTSSNYLFWFDSIWSPDFGRLEICTTSAEKKKKWRRLSLWNRNRKCIIFDALLSLHPHRWWWRRRFSALLISPDDQKNRKTKQEMEKGKKELNKRRRV
jgi:hypothetical protein